MPLRLGVLAYPAMVLALQLAKSNAVAEFERAEAYSPETSRRPESLKVSRKSVARAVRRGVLVSLGDGRYHLDRAAVRRRDRRMMVSLVVSGVVAAGLVWVLW